MRDLMDRIPGKKEGASALSCESKSGGRFQKNNIRIGIYAIDFI
jgi:hypothetical protein